MFPRPAVQLHQCRPLTLEPLPQPNWSLYQCHHNTVYKKGLDSVSAHTGNEGLNTLTWGAGVLLDFSQANPRGEPGERRETVPRVQPISG